MNRPTVKSALAMKSVLRLSDLAITSLWLLTGSLAGGEIAEVRLWPGGAPGSEGRTTRGNVRVTEGGEQVVTGVHSPSLMPYLPAVGKGTGTALLVIPGGGHRELWMDHDRS